MKRSERQPVFQDNYSNHGLGDKLDGTSSTFPSHTPEQTRLRSDAGMSRVVLECLNFGPTCAPQRGMSTIRDLLRGNVGNVSHAAPHVVSHTRTHTNDTLCLHKDMGAGHPSLRENKDEIQVRSHPKTRRRGLACEQTCRGGAIFRSSAGIHPLNLHNWNSTRVSS